MPSGAPYERTFTSRVTASPEEVWAHVITMAGVNAELWPLLQMTAPREASDLDISAMPLGRTAFRSWVLLFGMLPIDRSDLTILSVAPGHFLERSPMWSQELWQHERTIEAAEGGCTITDRLTFSPRFAGPVIDRFVGVLFRHRHAVLRRTFGG
jgi:ligand-binding SRPBCC domain-containing protein